jgi:anti-sigma factor RsiW
MNHDDATCREMLERISAYLDGDLDERSCRDVRRHCRDCPACATLLANLERTVGLCREAGAKPLPESVREQARAHVRDLLRRAERRR